MSIKITMDRVALATLIENDPEFKVELQRVVISETIRRVVLRDASEILPLLEPAKMAELLEELDEREHIRQAINTHLTSLVDRDGYFNYGKFKPKPATVEMLNRAFAPLVKEHVDQVKKAADSLMKEAAKEASQTIEDRVQKRVDRIVEENIVLEVNRRVKAKMDAMFAQAKDV